MKILIEAALSEKALMNEQADADADADSDTDSASELGSSETSAGMLQYLEDLTADQLQSVVSAGERATGIDIDQDGDVDSDESDQDTDTEPDSVKAAEPAKPAEPAKAAKPKIKRSEKTAYIQKVIGAPSAKGKEKGDGQWGQKTSDAWRAWIKTPETKKKLLALAKEKKLNESSDLFNLFSRIISEQEEPADDASSEEASSNLPDKLKELIANGAAGPIASYFGFKGNLTGVDDLVRALEDIELPEEATDAEQEGDDDKIDFEDLKDLNTKIEELSIPANAEFFKMKGAAFTSKNPRRTIDIDINNPETWKGQTKYITDDGELKIFKEGEIDTDKNAGKVMKKMFFNQSAGEIIIGKGGRDIKIFPVKLEDGFVVADKKEDAPKPPAETENQKTNESLSRGALIRKRYYGRY